MRDYRPGDPIKHVDWKSWARLGEPVVREYEDVYYPHHGLLLDTAVHPLFHQEFEEAVSVAASFACSLDTDEGLLDLVLIQQGAKVITVGKGVERLEDMMEVLACSEIETKPMWNDLTIRLAQLAPELSACIMVFAEWSEERAKLVNRTAAMGVNVFCFLVYQDHADVKALLAEHSTGVTIHLLKVGEVQKDLDQALGFPL